MPSSTACKSTIASLQITKKPPREAAFPYAKTPRD
jgi:hypothetical protein